MAESTVFASLDYGKVDAVRRALAAQYPEVERMSLPEFAQAANEATQSEQFSAGLNDNFVKRASNYLDRLLSPVSNVTGDVGEVVGETVGFPDVGRTVGESLPRGLLEVSPVGRGYQLMKAGSMAAGALAALPGLASAGAGTYTATDSPMAGMVGAAGLGAMFPMAGAAEGALGRGIAKLLYEPVLKGGVEVGRASVGGAGMGLLERGTEAVARNVAGGANQFLTAQGVSLASTGQLRPLDKEFAAEVIGGTVPFSLLDVPGVLRGPRMGPDGRSFRSTTEFNEAKRLVGGLERSITPEDRLKSEEVVAETERILSEGKEKAERAQRVQQTVDTYNRLEKGGRLGKEDVTKLGQVAKDLVDLGAAKLTPEGELDVDPMYVKMAGREVLLDALQQREKTRVDDTGRVEEGKDVTTLYHSTLGSHTPSVEGARQQGYQSLFGLHVGSREQAEVHVGDYNKDKSLYELQARIQKPYRVTDAEAQSVPALKLKMIQDGLIPESALTTVLKVESGSAARGTPEQVVYLLNALKKAGYDSLVYANTREGGGGMGDSYVLLDDANVKGVRKIEKGGETSGQKVQGQEAEVSPPQATRAKPHEKGVELTEARDQYGNTYWPPSETAPYDENLPQRRRPPVGYLPENTSTRKLPRMFFDRTGRKPGQPSGARTEVSEDVGKPRQGQEKVGEVYYASPDGTVVSATDLRVAASKSKFPEDQWTRVAPPAKETASGPAPLPELDSPEAAIVHLDRTWRDLKREYEKQVQPVKDGLVTATHSLYGKGTYLKADLQPTGTKPLSGTEGLAQVYIGNQPTEYVVRDGKYEPAKADAVVSPDWMTPVVTKEILQARVNGIRNAMLEAFSPYRARWYQERDRILQEVGLPTVESLRATIGRKFTEATWDKYAEKAWKLKEQAQQLGLQVAYINKGLTAADMRDPLVAGEIAAKFPFEWKVAKLKQLTASIVQALSEARKTEKGVHPFGLDLEIDFRKIDEELAKSLDVLPPQEAAERVYRSHTARLAEAVNKLQMENDALETRLREKIYGKLLSNSPELGVLIPERKEPTLGHPPRANKDIGWEKIEPSDKPFDPDEGTVMERLNALEALPHGKGALQGLIRFAEAKKNVSLGGGRTAEVDIGRLGDIAYFRILQKFSELADPHQWDLAKKKFDASREASSLVLSENSEEYNAAVADKYLRGRFKIGEDADPAAVEAVKNIVLHDMMEAWRETMDDPSIPLTNEDRAVLFSQSDPVQVESNALLKSWFEAEFPTQEENRRLSSSPEKWGNEILTVATRRASTRDVALIKTKSLPTMRETKFWNNILAVLRSGKIKDFELVWKPGDGYTFTKPANLEGLYNVTGFEYRGDPNGRMVWTRFKAEAQGMVDRLNAKFVRWLEKKGAEGGTEPQASAMSERDIERLNQQGSTTQSYQDALSSIHPPTSDLALAAGTRDWFKTHFALSGVDPVMGELYSDIATKVALAFKDVGKGHVAELLSSTALGIETTSKYSNERYSRILVALNHGFPAKDTRVDASRRLLVAAHEITHALFNPVNKSHLSVEVSDQVSYVTKLVNDLPADRRGEIISQWYGMLIPKSLMKDGELSAQVQAIVQQSSQHPQEFIANFASAAVLGLVRPDTVTKLTDLMAGSGPVEHQFLKALYVPLLDVAQGMEMFYNKLEPWLGTQMATLSEGVRKVLKTSREIDQAVAGLKNIELIDPEAYQDLVQSGTLPKMVAYEVPLQMIPGGVNPMRLGKLVQAGQQWLGLTPPPKGVEWPIEVPVLQRALWPSAQLSAAYPALQPAFDVVRAFRGIANSFARKAAEPLLKITKGLFGLAPKEVIDPELTGLKYVVSNPTATKAVTLVELAQNQMKRLFSEKEIRQLLAHMPAETVDAVIKFEKAATVIYTNMGQAIVGLHEELVPGQAELILRHYNQAAPTPQLRASAKIVAEAARRFVGGDQTAVAAIQALGLPGADKAFEASVLLATKVADMRQKIVGKPWFRSEMRLGKYSVAWKEANGEGGFQAFDSREEANNYATGLVKRGIPQGVINVWNKYDRMDATKGMHPDFVQSLTEIESASFKADLMKLNLPQALYDQIVQAHVPMAAAAREIGQHGFGGFMLEQKLRPGREELNMPLGMVHYLQAMSTILAKKKATMDFALAMADPTLKGQDALKKLARQHFQAVVNPTAKEWQVLKRGIFAYYLGFSPSQMLIEMTQTLSTFLPQLTRDSGSFFQGTAAWKDGLGLMMKVARKQSLGKELDAALKRARAEQVIDFGVTQEFADTEAIGAGNLGNILQGGSGLLKVAKGAHGAMDYTFRVMRDMYSMMPRLNSHMAFLTAYKMARERGVLVNDKLTKLSAEEAYNYAKHTVDRTMFSGGTAARPVLPFANSGWAQGALGAMYSLGSFTFSTLAMYHRLAQDSLRGLTSSERSAARKALGQMALTQAALAGALGLPLAGAMMAVVEQMYPELEITKNTKEAVDKAMTAVMGGDEEYGNIASDIALRGLPFGALKVDTSSRMALSNLLGVSPYDGFNVENFIGPAGSLIGNMFRGMRDFAAGDVNAGVKKIMPTPLKALTDLYTGGGEVRDTRGRPILSDMTTSERILYAAGFKPARLQKAREAQQLIEKHDAVVRKENTQFHRNLAEQLLAGDVAGVREQIKERYGRLKNQGYNPIEGARQVAEAAVDRVMPLDPSENGPRLAAQDRQQMAARAGIVPGKETERVATKKRLEAALGVPGVAQGMQTAMRKASIVDRLRESNPLLSRQEATEMVDRILASQHQSRNPFRSPSPGLR